jgi:hypothetical protein
LNETEFKKATYENNEKPGAKNRKNEKIEKEKK